MHTLKKVVDKILEIFCMSLMAFMTVLVTWQVFTRYILNNPSATSEVLAKYLFVWMVLYGTAYVFGLREHMSITFIKESFPLKIQYILELITEGVLIAFAVMVMLQGGLVSTVKQMVQLDSALQIPIGVLYSAIPISGLLIIFYSIYNIFLVVSKFRKGV